MADGEELQEEILKWKEGGAGEGALEDGIKTAWKDERSSLGGWSGLFMMYINTIT